VQSEKLYCKHNEGTTHNPATKAAPPKKHSYRSLRSDGDLQRPSQHPPHKRQGHGPDFGYVRQPVRADRVYVFYLESDLSAAGGVLRLAVRGGQEAGRGFEGERGCDRAAAAVVHRFVGAEQPLDIRLALSADRPVHPADRRDTGLPHQGESDTAR